MCQENQLLEVFNWYRISALYPLLYTVAGVHDARIYIRIWKKSIESFSIHCYKVNFPQRLNKKKVDVSTLHYFRTCSYHRDSSQTFFLLADHPYAIKLSNVYFIVMGWSHSKRTKSSWWAPVFIRDKMTFKFLYRPKGFCRIKAPLKK